MAFSSDFDTPQTASAQTINVTGTIAASAIQNLALQLTVSRYPGTATNYYLTQIFTNTTTSPSSISESLYMAIVPQILTGETVTSVTSYGSFTGNIVLS